MNKKIGRSETNRVGIKSKNFLVMMLTTGVISSLLSIGATLYVTKETTSVSIEIEKNKQRHSFYTKRFSILYEYRNEIYSLISQISNEDYLPNDANVEKIRVYVLKITKTMESVSNIFDKMIPFLDEDIKNQLLEEREDLINLEKKVLDGSKNNNQDTKSLQKYLEDGVEFMLSMRSKTDTQLSRINDELN